jgi:hypothetical protein
MMNELFGIMLLTRSSMLLQFDHTESDQGKYVRPGFSITFEEPSSHSAPPNRLWRSRVAKMFPALVALHNDRVSSVVLSKVKYATVLESYTARTGLQKIAAARNWCRSIGAVAAATANIAGTIRSPIENW